MKRAAYLAFAVAGAAGLVLAATTAWWLVLVGLVSVLAAWFYTGGSRPYGYLGLGEVMVFVFFGLVAVIGTTCVQTETWEWAALYAAIGVGALACAILVANNLRDIPTDVVAGSGPWPCCSATVEPACSTCSSSSSRPRPCSPSPRSPRGGRWSASASWCSPCRRAAPCSPSAGGPGLILVLQSTRLAELAWAALVAAALVVSS